jgi:hypothetical protein
VKAQWANYVFKKSDVFIFMLAANLCPRSEHKKALLIARTKPLYVFLINIATNLPTPPKQLHTKVLRKKN